jgi:hypothetical protein
MTGTDTTSAQTPEFSRVIEIEAIEPGEPRTFSYAATPAECAALGRRLQQEQILSLEVGVTVTRVRGGAHLVFDLSGRLIQTCVVTNLRFEASVSEIVEVDALAEPEYSRRLAALDAAEPEDDQEPPEQLVDGRVDAGELATEYFSLAIDPYPRSPEAPGEPVEREVFTLRGGTAPEGKGREHPFAKLAALKQRMDTDTPEGGDAS